MKVAVLIPSHLKSDSDVSNIYKCLDSLMKQTVVPDIYASISFANDSVKQTFTKEVMQEFSKVKYAFSKEQKFQMEHLYNLVRFINKYDLIMFCDDDDTYVETRVEGFIYYYQQGKKEGPTAAGAREFTVDKDVDCAPEYWAYAIIPSLLEVFFERFKDNMDLLKHKWADMYLRDYLRRTGGNNTIIVAIQGETPMYNYNISNPDSICSIYKKMTKDRRFTNTVILDNLLLATITIRNDMFIEQKNASRITDSQMKKVFPERERIAKFVEQLYL